LHFWFSPRVNVVISFSFDIVLISSVLIIATVTVAIVAPTSRPIRLSAPFGLCPTTLKPEPFSTFSRSGHLRGCVIERCIIETARQHPVEPIGHHRQSGP